MTPQTHTPTRALASGGIWPQGRDAARDAAQVREFARALETTPSAATVAA